MRRLSTNAVMYSGATVAVVKLHTTDMECLELLTLHGPLSAGQFARLTGLTTGSTTTMVDRLQAKGYVYRQQDTSDRRHITIVPNTEKIDKDFDHISAPMGKAMLSLISTYSQAEMQIITRFLQNAVAEAEIGRLADWKLKS
jgi:DNA-binding MarR family transcriptional regulator